MTVANWQLIALRVLEGMILIGICIAAVAAILVPLAVSAGMSDLRDVKDPSEVVGAIAQALTDHWIVIVYALVVVAVVFLIIILMHAFVEGATAQILVDSDRLNTAPAFNMSRWFAGGRKSWWTIFWIYNAIWSIACLVLLVPLGATIAFMLSVSDNGARVAIGCGGIVLTFLILLPLSVIAGVWTQKSIAVCLARDAGAAAAMGIARKEAMADFGRHFAVAVIIFVVMIGGSGVISMLTFPASFAKPDSMGFGMMIPLQLGVSFLQSIFSAAAGTWFLGSFVALTEDR